MEALENINMTTRYAPKKGSYCGAEIQRMVGTLLQFGASIQQDEDLVFEKTAASLEGKRTKEQIKAWFYNTKKIFEYENRWTKNVELYLTPIEKERLKAVFLNSYKSNLDGGVNPIPSAIVSDETKEKAIKDAILKLFDALSETSQNEVRFALMKI